MWERLKAIGLGALYVGFAAIGVILLTAGGDVDDRLLGLTVVLFFGGGGLMVFVIRSRAGHRGRPLRAGSVIVGGNQRPAFVADADRITLVSVLGGLLAMGAATVLILLRSDVAPVLVWLAGIAVAGLAVYVLARIARVNRLAITRSGIVSVGPFQTVEIAWDNVVAAGAYAIYGNNSLGIAVADQSRITRGRIGRLLMGANRSLMGADVSLPLSSYDVDPDEVLAAITRYLNEPERRGRIGDPSELDAIRSQRQAAEEAETSTATVRSDPWRVTLAVGVMYLVGGALLLVVLLAVLALGDAPPDDRSNRIIGAGVIGLVGLAILVSGRLVMAGRRLGRWTSVGSMLALSALLVLVALTTDADARAAWFVGSATAFAITAFVGWAVVSIPDPAQPGTDRTT